MKKQILFTLGFMMCSSFAIADCPTAEVVERAMQHELGPKLAKKIAADLGVSPKISAAFDHHPLTLVENPKGFCRYKRDGAVFFSLEDIHGDVSPNK